MTAFGVCSEFQRLRSVLLHKPGPEIGNHPNPAAIQHLRPIDHAAMKREFAAIVEAYVALGIQVRFIDPTPIGTDHTYLYNMMYCRDLLFMTPRGAIISRMANDTRKEEVTYAERTLSANGIPILGRISAPGTFEGADALWISERLVAIGVGNRTDSHAFEQLQSLLAGIKVEAVALPSYQASTQHLLGSVQIVDGDLALVRHEIVDARVEPFLKEHGFRVIPVPENQEVRSRQAMNIVTIAPGTIIMTAGCPETRTLYEKAGLTVAAEISIDQLINGAGGLACATGILARKE